MNKKENFVKGFIKENPLFVSLLGMCPSLAVTTSLENAIGMTMGVFFVLVLSNLIISLIMSNPKLAELVKPVRIPVYIVVIATLVTIVEMFMHAFVIDLYRALGVFIPLIVVNCIILGRAEAFASSNKPVNSLIDGAGMALGYGAAIMLISIFREFLGKGTLTIWGDLQLNLTFFFNFLKIEPIAMFVQPVGAFLTFGLILAGITAIANNHKNKLAKEVTNNG
ncbi:MAG: electron transport complex subunit RsxE [Candidatus Izemoplasmatales bacterium]|nr:electron transport complex subunit RsxE [Candidatus Izemoplasmatales bacterium]